MTAVIALSWTATVGAAWKRAAAHRHRKDGTLLCKVCNQQQHKSEARERIVANCARVLFLLFVDRSKNSRDRERVSFARTPTLEIEFLSACPLVQQRKLDIFLRCKITIYTSYTHPMFVYRFT